MTGAADYDAIVVGAGPAGSAIGILLAEEGMTVLVLDRATFPRSKMCGEYLSPETARILHRLGVLDTVDRAGAVPLWGMSITGPDGSRIVGTYPTTGRWRGYRDHALAIPGPPSTRSSPTGSARRLRISGEVSRDRSDHGRQSGRGCRGLRPRGSAPALAPGS
jgi:choline dehydrogenase-like flavoprotein